ncbi:hypothetical protein EV356DRAFT_517769 [Viridothelium virens]|uniref:Uncharacterized protein n=1 Tax=Viridothelium virens TaxID=1048519 RepID=A0A6A6H214_VIRVR|nr:hypothetical protein EV356DRAFT_517769 [Viridothelium virens]
MWDANTVLIAAVKSAVGNPNSILTTKNRTNCAYFRGGSSGKTALKLGVIVLDAIDWHLEPSKSNLPIPPPFGESASRVVLSCGRQLSGRRLLSRTATGQQRPIATNANKQAPSSEGRRRIDGGQDSIDGWTGLEECTEAFRTRHSRMLRTLFSWDVFQPQQRCAPR